MPNVWPLYELALSTTFCSEGQKGKYLDNVDNVRLQRQFIFKTANRSHTLNSIGKRCVNKEIKWAAPLRNFNLCLHHRVFFVGYDIIFSLRAIFIRVLKIILDWLSFTLIPSVIGSENSCPFLNQSDVKLKAITTWSPAFSRALGSLVGFTLSNHWLLKVFSYFLITCWDCFNWFWF